MGVMGDMRAARVMRVALAMGIVRIAHAVPRGDGVRVMAMMPVVMRLRRRDGETEDGGRNQGRRHQTGKPANPKATATQRHELVPPHSRDSRGPSLCRCVTHTVANDMSARLRRG